MRSKGPRVLLLAICAGVAVAFQQGVLPRAKTSLQPLSTRHTSRQQQKQQHWSSLSKNLPLRGLSIPRSKTTQSNASAAGSDAAAPSKITFPKSVVAAFALVGLDIFFRRLLQSLSISFPSSLAGCGALFATFLFAPGGSTLYNLLNPGASLLAKWLPVFFVPSLVTLPLADRVGSAAELFKVASVVVGGFYFTLLSTAWTVVAVRKVLASKEENPAPAPEEDASPSEQQPTKQLPNKVAAAKPFSGNLNTGLRLGTAASGVAATAASQLGLAVATPLSTAFMLCATLMNFVFGARLPKKFTKVVHPVVTCTTLTSLTAWAFAKVTGSSFFRVLRGYRTKNLSFGAAGAGDLLLFLLGPAVVSLACQMYERRKLMRENLAEVGAAVTVSAFGGIFGTAFAVNALQIASPYLRLSLLSRNITSPLAMAIAGILGADVSLAVSIVVITGLIGANFGASILDFLGIKDPVARGLGIGAAAHGLGTAAFVNEKDAFPFAAIAMALTASATTVIVSVPLFKKFILQLALGA